MTILRYCLSCYRRFLDNPEKHRYRPKLCPYCRTPYTSGSIMPLGLKLPNPKRTLQKIFAFIVQHKRKAVYYVCPQCREPAYTEKDFKIKQFPDKTRTVMVKGQPQTVVLTWRSIPACRMCGTLLVRQSIKKVKP